MAVARPFVGIQLVKDTAFLAFIGLPLLPTTLFKVFLALFLDKMAEKLAL